MNFDGIVELMRVQYVYMEDGADFCCSSSICSYEGWVRIMIKRLLDDC